MQIVASRHRIIFSLVAFIRTAFSFLELLLLVRIILEFLRASQDAVFVYAINRLTDPLLWPFVGTFQPYILGSGFVLQFHIILALLVYAFIGYLLVRGITALSAHRSLFTKNIN